MVVVDFGRNCCFVDLRLHLCSMLKSAFEQLFSRCAVCEQLTHHESLVWYKLWDNFQMESTWKYEVVVSVKGQIVQLTCFKCLSWPTCVTTFLFSTCLGKKTHSPLKITFKVYSKEREKKKTSARKYMTSWHTQRGHKLRGAWQKQQRKHMLPHVRAYGERYCSVSKF